MKFPSELLRECWFLTGPTACGKTAAGIALTTRINGEIVSLDSMAVYRGMDIGTAKPTPSERAQVPHHLLDVVDPHEEFTTVDYLRLTLEACRQILERGHVPLFVGGTGLYLRSVLRGVFAGPPANWEFRREMHLAAQQHTGDWLHQQVQSVDPSTAAKLHPRDERRLLRALEIFRFTGQPPSALHDERPLPAHQRSPNVFWLSPPRDWLYDRIDQRVVQMLKNGLIEEVQQLLARPDGLGHTALQGLGYKEVIQYLEGTIASTQDLTTRIQTRTRQFAKRQGTWFRNMEECIEIKLSGVESADDISRILWERSEEIASHASQVQGDEVG